jgi:hypothetical protein
MQLTALVILTLAWVSLAPISHAGQVPAASQPAAATRPDANSMRVILHVNRNLDVPGYLQLEDDDVIVIRTLKGEVESYPKARVLDIIRLVDPQPGQSGLVVMRDGQTREGVILQDTFDYVLMEIQGIRAKLKRDTVSHVVLQPTFDERYAQFKAGLQPGMHDAHFALCKWLTEQRRYELARQELTELLQKTDMADARRLLTIVEAQLAMSEKTGGGIGDGGNGDGAPATAPENPPAKRKTGPVYLADLLPAEIISRDDVNIIRVYEIDFDHPPRVTIAPDTVRELIEKYATNKLIPASQTGRTELFRAAADRPLDVVRLMFQIAARDLYAKVQVNSEPYALNLFRQRVHDTWLINNCATTACHGGPYAGRLFLHRKNYKDDRVRYTNLLILERLKLDPEWPLINYDKPEDSLVIQYGLPRAVRIPRSPTGSRRSARLTPA